MITRKIAFAAVAIAAIVSSCKDKATSEKKFTVTGTITNNMSKVIYLEEIPMTSMQPSIADSFIIDKNGKFELHTATTEARLYNLRLDQNQYPVTSVINDAEKVELTIRFSKENNQFAESYEVKGSKASSQMKDYMVAFNGKLQEIFFNSQRGDSLAQAKAPDSVLNGIRENIFNASAAARKLSDDAIKNSSNPALSMFIISYYQTSASNQGYNLMPMEKADVVGFVNDAAAKFPDHQGLASIRNSLQGWIGKQAPEINLPDANGKQVSLSSFKGKYVLVDFWASWCRPCRMENPNVVKAYNRFKDKNFTILGVSFDKPGDKEAWQQAVKDDNLTWTQVSDLQHWNSPVVAAYKIEGIPFNVLVDPQGRIIAEGLRGEELEKKLESVLK
ncbi:MAG: TlpA disulfide reductase family protein [Bacteroidetes bacterium]|nr:TlpA disulfide reductase family protein [Bacteroidota bacterium]